MAVVYIASESQWDDLVASHTYVVADFHATWCGPCKQIAPHYAKMASSSSQQHLAFAKIDVDAVPQLASRYGVSAMPTFMFFKEGRQVAVNGQPLIRGADVRALGMAVGKLEGLAKARGEAAAAKATTA